MSRSKLRVFLALDVDTKEEAFSLVERWCPHIVGFKVGPRLGFQLSQTQWRELSKKSEVFIDYKFFDIPSTVISCVKMAFDSGASFCTVHALNGFECLKGLAKLEKELNQIRPFRVLGVTLLTSFDQEKNKLPLSKNMKSGEIVNTLADVVFDSGLSGLVCSVEEISEVKKKKLTGIFITPGIRFSTDLKDDQKRVTTPNKAWAYGATYLVMGRSLIRAKNFEKTLNDLETAWQTV